MLPSHLRRTTRARLMARGPRLVYPEIMGFFQEYRARKLHSEGQARSAAGDEEGALARYRSALELDASRPETLYNIGLIYKYRRAWPESLEFNARASALAPNDEATLWNLGIAATALRNWDTARRSWNTLGIDVGESTGPIEADFGRTPVRLNPDKNAEVVWADRIDPVRARVINIPFAESGFRYGDLVLHDGAPVGSRLDQNGNERSVFNVLELFHPSSYSTFEARLDVLSEHDMSVLESLCEEPDLHFEDWTANTRLLCKACSEGRPHEHHDEGGSEGAWRKERHVALACPDDGLVSDVVNRWAATGSGRAVLELRCTLRRA
jgi:hypothetical protein